MSKKKLEESRYFGFPIENNVSDAKEEENAHCLEALKQIADNNNAILLAFIAPYVGKKVSPVDIARAVIGIEEEIGIETTLEIMKSKLGNLKGYDLFLLLETPGGDVDTSYKIARLLGATFKSVTVFIVHEAASGGTLISLVGSKIKMGEMASLSPIDIQTRYQGAYVSVNMAASSLTSIAQFFKTRKVEQVEYPYTALANKLDPIIYEDWSSRQWAMVQYAHSILSLTGYTEKQKLSVIKNLVFTKNPHNFVVLKETASRYGLAIAQENELSDEFNCMRWWLNNYMFQEGASHVIRYVLPENKLTAIQNDHTTIESEAQSE